MDANRVPLVTKKEAAQLRAARDALAAITDRAGARSWSADADAARMARVAATVSLAREVLTSALVTAHVYGESEEARSVYKDNAAHSVKVA